MFKKALQIAVTFSLLLGGYAGYTQVFRVATLLLGQGQVGELTPFPEVDAKSARKAAKLARESFGPDFWASKEKLKLNYIEEQRGYYFYAENHEFKNDRKQLVLTPFALIWVSVDGKSHKTATSDMAIIDMSQPLATFKPGAEPSHITHATLVGNVRIRDDKGTHDDLTDDLRIGPMAQVDYDEKALQITSESEIILEDRNLNLTGMALMIQLRRKLTFYDPNQPPVSGGGTGFDAEKVFVYRDVHVRIKNGGQGGILPGKSKPEKSGDTPIDVWSDRELTIVLPPPHPPLLVGPPDLTRKPEPTFVSFRTNVRVIRGTAKADQLNCETLDLTLLPKPRPPEAVKPETLELVEATPTPTPKSEVLTSPASTAEAAPQGSSGPLTDLQLHKAVARGDAVWIQSESQGLVARCVELIHEKPGGGVPDTTYLNGGTSRKLWIERTELDAKAIEPGTIKSILTMKASDATIFDYGPGGTSRVVARGPAGRADERPARNAPIQRTAYWEDEMEMISWRDGEGVMPAPHVEAIRALKDARNVLPPRGTLRRVITMTGVSKLVDHGKATATEPGQTTTLDAQKSIVAEFQAGPKASPEAPEGPTEIKWLDAYADAHLTAPGKTLTAREFLKAKFKTPPPPPTPAAAFGPVLAGGPPPATPPPEPKPDPAPQQPEPAVDGRADRIWATLLLGSAGSKGELENAMLRGGVMVHQDPTAGTSTPNEASGEAIDLTGQGQGLMRFAVKAEDSPQAFDPRTKLASRSNGRRPPSVSMARVDFQGKVIESENVIGLDQRSNFAYVDGAGVFTQMTERAMFDDKGLATNQGGKSGPQKPQDKLVIYWNDQMRFFGVSKDLDGNPAAKIEFRGTSKQVRTPDGKTEFRRGVDARMTESVLLADRMDVYMDRTINLAKDTRKGEKKPDGVVEPDPQIAMIDCLGKNVYENGKVKIPGVDIINEKKYPGTNDLKEKQRINGVSVIYDKRTGEFESIGAGTTWLYQRDAKADVKLPKGVLPPLKLTKVKYVEGMQGRFGVARDQVENQEREAIFDGSAQAANATVLSGNGDIDFDLPRAKDYVFLTSDRIHVFSYPLPVGSKASAKQLLKARGNSTARTIDSLIQADRITYDSSTELMYAYGEDDKEVALTKQESPGQPTSTTRGKMLRYNKATRASDLKDPQSIVFTDLSSGFRPKAYYPDLGGSGAPFVPPKPQRLPFMRSQRSNTERKQFTGQ